MTWCSWYIGVTVAGLYGNQKSLTQNTRCMSWALQIDGLVQERRNSGALAMDLRLSCTNPSRSFPFYLSWKTTSYLQLHWEVVFLRRFNCVAFFTNEWIFFNRRVLQIQSSPIYKKLDHSPQFIMKKNIVAHLIYSKWNVFKGFIIRSFHQFPVYWPELVKFIWK